MPPRVNVIVEPSPSPPPPDINDAQDILVIHDIMDTLDQLPPELTRVHSDLNELGAVLYSTLLNLEAKLNQLIDWIQTPSIEPAKRFQLLQEIAEEAARYKLGGDDKIRVAGGACDGIIAHQRHISNLLASSTLLVQGPPSPYSLAMTLSQAPVYTTSSRRVVARAVNSPFGGPASRGPGAGTTGTGETPTKKKKNRIQALNVDDDASSVGGDKKKAPAKKRKPAANRATSPADSLASASAFAASRPVQPQTARQLAAAMNKAKKAERADDSDDESEDDKDGAPGADIASREGSHIGGRSANETAIMSNAAAAAAEKARRNNRGVKRARGDGDDDEDSDDKEDDGKPGVKRTAKKVATGASTDHQPDPPDSDAVGESNMDETVYCICQRVSYGEMIGCDDEDCAYEWFHIGCLGLDKLPEGNWICPTCTERRKKNPKKKPAKSKAKKP